MSGKNSLLKNSMSPGGLRVEGVESLKGRGGGGERPLHNCRSLLTACKLGSAV